MHASICFRKKIGETIDTPSVAKTVQACFLNRGSYVQFVSGAPISSPLQWRQRLCWTRGFLFFRSVGNRQPELMEQVRGACHGSDEFRLSGYRPSTHDHRDYFAARGAGNGDGLIRSHRTQGGVIVGGGGAPSNSPGARLGGSAGRAWPSPSTLRLSRTTRAPITSHC